MRLLLTIVTICLLVSACGAGDDSNNGGNSYYSASATTYYQIESKDNESFILNIVTNSGNSIKNIPLIPSQNGYTFAGIINGNNLAGSIVIKNNLLGISVTNSGGSIQSFADFATTSANTNTDSLPSGTYTTVCDQDNISACVINIVDNQISITEYSISGQPTVLCSNASITQASASINPYSWSFSCGVQGGMYSGTWSVMPLVINGATALMLSEYSPNFGISNSITNEIAFVQGAFSPNGNYNYVYNGTINNQAGIATTSFSNNSLINTVVGSCAGAACALIQGQYAGAIGSSGNVLSGFDYYSVNGTVNYNLVGSSTMNIFVDSFSGIYF